MQLVECLNQWKGAGGCYLHALERAEWLSLWQGLPKLHLVVSPWNQTQKVKSGMEIWEKGILLIQLPFPLSAHLRKAYQVHILYVGSTPEIMSIRGKCVHKHTLGGNCLQIMGILQKAQERNLSRKHEHQYMQMRRKRNEKGYEFSYWLWKSVSKGFWRQEREILRWEGETSIKSWRVGRGKIISAKFQSQTEQEPFSGLRHLYGWGWGTFWRIVFSCLMSWRCIGLFLHCRQSFWCDLWGKGWVNNPFPILL